MEFKSKLLIVALASAMPWMSAQAQSQSELQKEIAALRAQLQALQQKVESLNAKADAPAASAAVVQQVNRLEQRLDLADDEAEKTGFKGLKINATTEVGYFRDSSKNNQTFGALSGSSSDSIAYAGAAMVQITKDTQGEGVDWTLRLQPGAQYKDGNNFLVHEASVAVPVAADTKLIGGLIPDYQGYEYVFPNSNATLGNQLISHNALFDLAGATQYAGLGTSHTFDGGKYAAKWMIGNVDPWVDSEADTTKPYFNGTKTRSVALAYRADWFMSEFAYVGLSGLHGSVNRNFRVMTIDGGYTHGDWQINGQLTNGWMRNGASISGMDAEWTGVSALLGYKATPRLQLLARADYIENRKNGGGTYAYAQGSTDVGLGAELNEDGTNVTDDAGNNVGANLTRLTFGTNYQINANTQWKLEYRIDQSSGYNFVDENSNRIRQKNRIGTTLVLSF